MVRSTEEYLAVINAFKRSYLQVSLQGRQGMCSLFIYLARSVEQWWRAAIVTWSCNAWEVLFGDGVYNKLFPRYLVPLFQNESSNKNDFDLHD